MSRVCPPASAIGRAGRPPIVSVLVLSVVATTGVAIAQPPARPAVPPQPASRPVWLLQNESFRKELKLDEEQTRMLADVEREFRQKAGEAWSKADSPEARAEVQKAMQEQQQEVSEKLLAVLKPGQRERLEQLSTQMRVLQGGPMALFSAAQSLDLGITNEQREELREKVMTLDRELRKQEATLRRKALDDVIALLTPEQREKFRSLVGEPFTLEMPDPPKRPVAPVRPKDRQGE